MVGVAESADEALVAAGLHRPDLAPMVMVQLDGDGCIVRVNQALLRESGTAAESVLGRSAAGLSMDRDPRIAKGLMHMLLQGGAFMGTPRPRTANYRLPFPSGAG